MALPNIPDIEILRKSATAGDINTYTGRGVVNMVIPFSGWGTSPDRLDLPPRLPVYWSYSRDDVLRSTIFKEAMWSAAVGIAVTKIAAKGFEITSDVPLRMKRGRDLILYADGRQVGWVPFISKHLRDYILTDNGAFVEIVRAGRGYGSQIIGIRHLDSRRCTRTGDPRVPVIYRDRRGNFHELRFFDVMMFSDMPDAGETYYGVGLCAASRAYQQIYKLAGLEWYVNEKVRGMQPLAIHIVNGILDKQIQDAVDVAKEEKRARGATAYMGAVIIGVPQQEQPQVATIPLAELPDKFNRKEEFDIAVLAYANALGLDPQELQPLTSQNLGAGSQSVILNQKAKGRGLASWMAQWTHQSNEWLLPESTIFAFREDDADDALKEAQVQTARAGASNARLEQGISKAEWEQQILAEAGDIPKDFLEEDRIQVGRLDDDEKPIAAPEQPVNTPAVLAAAGAAGRQMGPEFRKGRSQTEEAAANLVKETAKEFGISEKEAAKFVKEIARRFWFEAQDGVNPMKVGRVLEKPSDLIDFELEAAARLFRKFKAPAAAGKVPADGIA